MLQLGGRRDWVGTWYEDNERIQLEEATERSDQGACKIVWSLLPLEERYEDG